ncbi:MAG: hypothetical protein HY940_09425 [Gammaproteobacteria bacterium]|nr:hypothetical protein [Gammaproteobacteria bacterium]
MKLRFGDRSSLNSGRHSTARQSLKITCQILALLLLSLPAMAGLRPDIANCEELKDADIQEQIKLCTAHAGCDLIMGSKRSCVTAKTFLVNLKAAVGEGTKSLFGYRKKVTSNHVFTASLSDAARKVEQLPAVRTILEGNSWDASKEARDARVKEYGVYALGLLAQIDAADKDVLKLTYGTTGKIIYIGKIHSGFLNNGGEYPSGYGTMFFDNGEIHRGDFFNTSVSGKGDFLLANGVRRIGWVGDNDAPHKNFDQVVVYPGGEVYQGRLDVHVKPSGKGTLKWPNGNLKEEGLYEFGKLVAGKRYNEDGTIGQFAEEDPAARQAREERERLAKAREDEQERLAKVKAAEDARIYQEELARKRERDSRDTAAALGTLLGVMAQNEQNKADRAQARQEEQQRQLLAQQAQQRLAQAQQDRAYQAEAAQAEAFNREAALAAEQRARQNAAVANSAPIAGTVIYDRQGGSQSQPSASGPPAMGHIEMGGGLKGTTAIYDYNQDRRAQEQRQREQEHKESVSKYEEDVRRNQAQRAEDQRKADEEGARRQQQFTNQRLGREAARNQAVANIKAEINRQDAITSQVISSLCPPQVVFANHTSVWITVNWNFTLTVDGFSFPASVASVVAPKSSQSEMILGTGCPDKTWQSSAGVINREDAAANYPSGFY